MFTVKINGYILRRSRIVTWIL